MSSARSADTSVAMETDRPQQQKQQQTEHAPSQSLRQPSSRTPFGDDALQVALAEATSPAQRWSLRREPGATSCNSYTAFVHASS